MSSEPIVIEETFDASIHRVWDAITKLDQMKQWYFENIESFEPKVGFETRFNVRSGERDFLHIWTLTEVLPPKKIVYDWKYEAYPGDSSVTFELTEIGNQTTLRLTHQVNDPFPQDIPEFKRESGIEGWKYFINGRLKEFLNPKKP